MPSERSINPAEAHRKAEKARTLKKSKAALQVQRAEKLARRNPFRLERQIEELKAAETRAELRPKDKQTLEQLEKDVRAIRKAREQLGVKDEDRGDVRRKDGDGNRERERGRERRGDFGGRWTSGGKRKREDGRGHRGGDETEEPTTDEDVRRIPMPQDTPPPIPRPRRRDGDGPKDGSNNLEQLQQQQQQRSSPHPLPMKPRVVAQTVYEAKPAVRDLRKEATARFVPAVVARNKGLVKGDGRLVEEEELARLERSGYLGSRSGDRRDVVDGRGQAVREGEMADKAGGKGGDTLDEEERRFEAELQAEEESLRQTEKKVQIEEIQDEDR